MDDCTEMKKRRNGCEKRYERRYDRMTMKDLRNSLKLSQRAFAEQLGVTTAAVSRIENGQ
ncbi:MAG: helix-turn-helix transcriptional regulator, partial [Clostridia bacterium]